jgi:lysophospholipase L1-like esterase
MFYKLSFQLLLVTLLLEVGLRSFYALPEVLNFNRINYTLVSYFGGIRDIVNARADVTTNNTASYPPLRDVSLVWISEPDQSSTVISLNEYGFRGASLSVKRTPGVMRIIVLGDSFVEGMGVRNTEEFPYVLGATLQNTHRVEVGNFGVGGIGFPEYLKIAADTIPLFKPDLVILNTCFNDYAPAPLGARLPALDPQLLNPYLPRVYTLGRELAYGRIPRPRWNTVAMPFFRAVPDPSNPLTNNPNPDGVSLPILASMHAGRFNPFVINGATSLEPRLQNGIGPAGDYFSAINDIVQSVSGKMIVSYIPLHVSVSDRYYSKWNELGEDFKAPTLVAPAFRQQQRELKQMLEELKIPFVDTTPLLEREEQKNNQQFLGYDEHMNAAGYKTVGEALAETVIGLSLHSQNVGSVR